MPLALTIRAAARKERALLYRVDELMMEYCPAEIPDAQFEKWAAHQLPAPECDPHPDAPHGYDRDSSFVQRRYVCLCESWEPEEPYTCPIHGQQDGQECPRC